MQIIDCKKIREKTLLTVSNYVKNHTLKMVIVQVGDDQASKVYVRNKIKSCNEVGVECEHINLKDSSTFNDVAAVLTKCANDKTVNGIILQLPLPKQLENRKQALIDLIPVYKDIDGLTTGNIGRLWSGQQSIMPATAKGVLSIIEQEFGKIDGLNITIIGRSNLVGIPLNKMLLDKNATVTLCHSRTSSLVKHISDADVIITAIGKANYFDETFIRHGQCWIDVGINRDEYGKLCGDVCKNDFEHAKYDSKFTQVPGGVGILTTSKLLENLVQASEIQSSMPELDTEKYL